MNPVDTFLLVLCQGIIVVCLVALAMIATMPRSRPLRWDLWVGNTPEEVVFYIKHLVHWRGRRVDLHKMVRADGRERFHTHPAWAVRVVLRGGYVEEVYDEKRDVYVMRHWRPGMVGLVRPELCHRIARLPRGCSYSLWIRGRRRHEIRLVGEGWPQNQQRGPRPVEEAP